MVTLPNGKKRVRRTYTGDWYGQELPKARRILLRAAYVLITLGSMILFGFLATRMIDSNTAGYVAAAQMVSIVCFGWIIIALISYLTVKAKMTVGEYKSTPKQLKSATMATTVALGLCALGTVAHSLFVDMLPVKMLYALGYLVCAGMIFSINRIENSITYLKLPDDSGLSGNGVGTKYHP